VAALSFVYLDFFECIIMTNPYDNNVAPIITGIVENETLKLL
jgi:hypothetical protein